MAGRDAGGHRRGLLADLRRRLVAEHIGDARRIEARPILYRRTERAGHCERRGEQRRSPAGRGREAHEDLEIDVRAAPRTAGRRRAPPQLASPSAVPLPRARPARVAARSAGARAFRDRRRAHGHRPHCRDGSSDPSARRRQRGSRQDRCGALPAHVAILRRRPVRLAPHGIDALRGAGASTSLDPDGYRHRSRRIATQLILAPCPASP